MVNNGCVIIFVKMPEKGKVKSRLAASVGHKTALSLYTCFVDDLLAMLRRSRYPYIISFYPPDAEKRIRRWLSNERTFTPQIGEDLGERMKNAFIKVFSEGFNPVVLIGSDSPDLPEVIINEAFESLRDCDAVVGPSLDGGYYLIGFKVETFLPQLFDKIPWSSPEVFARTLDLFNEARRRIHILPEWRDVDTLDDLRAFSLDNATMPFSESATMRYMQYRKQELL